MFFFEDTNVFDYGFASMEVYFNNIPVLYMLFIPAVCMKMICEEKKLGTYDLLLVLPLNTKGILLAKYFASSTIAFLMFLPTLIYIYTLQQLIIPNTDLDYGSFITSYLGLSCLTLFFSAVSMYASSLTNSIITAFLLGVTINAFFFFGFDNFSKLFSYSNSLDYFLDYLGAKFHYENFSIGYLDVSDVMYFIILSGLFLFLTYRKIKVSN